MECFANLIPGLQPRARRAGGAQGGVRRARRVAARGVSEGGEGAGGRGRGGAAEGVREGEVRGWVGGVGGAERDGSTREDIECDACGEGDWEANVWRLWWG